MLILVLYLQQTPTNENNLNSTTPQTAKSTNKTRNRITVGVENTIEGASKLPKLRSVKLEKVRF